MFTVWTHPRYEGWYTYYLYGLERAGMLTAVGASAATTGTGRAPSSSCCASRLRPGRAPLLVYDFDDLGTTSWAILFLKRGTPPVVTPR